jgi:hypothetical protein
MSWEKLAPIKGGPGGCLHCGYQHDVFPMDGVIAVGFGYAAVTRDGQHIYEEPPDLDESKMWTGQMAEEAAKKDPDHDWRIHLVAPLSERHYQRQGDGHWVLYERGEGFA